MNCCRALCVCVCVCVFECACVQSLRGLPKYVIDPQDPLRPLIKWGRYWGDTRGPWKFLKFLRLTSPAHTHTVSHTHTHTCMHTGRVCSLSICCLVCLRTRLPVWVCVCLHVPQQPLCLSGPSISHSDWWVNSGRSSSADGLFPLLKPRGRGRHWARPLKEAESLDRHPGALKGDSEKDQLQTLRISGQIE